MAAGLHYTTMLSRSLTCAKCDGPVAESGDFEGFTVYNGKGDLVEHQCFTCGYAEWLRQCVLNGGQE